MPSVSATLRHLQGAQGLGPGVLREALLQTCGATRAGNGEAPLAPAAAEGNRSVSFSDVQQLRSRTPEFVGTRSSRYDIRAKRRAAERRKQRAAKQPGAEADGSDQRASLPGGPKDWWKHQQWAVGNDRQASQQAWRIERRESRLRPLASQPPFGKSAAAFSLDPVFDAQTRGRVETLSHELETSESFAATLIHKPRRLSKPRKLQLAPTKSLPDMAAGQGLRFIEAVNAIRSSLGLEKGLTPQEVVRHGCVQLGVEWRPEAATLKHSTWLLCEELGITTGWDAAQLRTMQASEVHPSWSAAPVRSNDTGSAVSLASASSNDSEILQKLRDEARIAVGSYAKAATAKMKKQAAREHSMCHSQTGDNQLASSTDNIEAHADQQQHRYKQPCEGDRVARRPGRLEKSGDATKSNPEWIDGFSQALDRAAAQDGRPVFVTTRPQTLKGKFQPAKGESFAFRPSFILPQTRVLIKQPAVDDREESDEPFSPVGR